MPDVMAQARLRARGAAEALKLATAQGRAELAGDGAVTGGTWLLVDHLAAELEERLGELEQLERTAARR